MDTRDDGHSSDVASPALLWKRIQESWLENQHHYMIIIISFIPGIKSRSVKSEEKVIGMNKGSLVEDKMKHILHET